MPPGRSRRFAVDETRENAAQAPRIVTRRRAHGARGALPRAHVEALFRRLAAHTALEQDEQAALASILKDEVAFDANAVIVERGERAESAFAVTSGWAARTMTLGDGRRQIVNFMLPGDLFDLQVFAGEPADHTVRALTPVRIAPVGREALMAVVNSASALSGALWWASVREEAVLREQVVLNGRRGHPGARGEDGRALTPRLAIVLRLFHARRVRRSLAGPRA